VLFVWLQTITGAMSTLSPPVSLEHNSNQGSVDYIQDVASQHDFDYPQVSFFPLSFFMPRLWNLGRDVRRKKHNTLIGANLFASQQPLTSQLGGNSSSNNSHLVGAARIIEEFHLVQ